MSLLPSHLRCQANEAMTSVLSSRANVLRGHREHQVRRGTRAPFFFFAAQLVAEAVKPPIRWSGAEAPAPACATASRQLQIAPATRVFVAATAAPRRLGTRGGLQLSY